MPMRTPILWSEALLKQTVPESAPSGSGFAPPAFSDLEDPLRPRNMHDSHSELILPFGSEFEILEQYTNASGGVRTGKCVSLRLTFHVHG
jgi:acyl-coenzyme A thioesterase 9